MPTQRLYIVGLPYNEVGRCLDAFYAEAPGRIMTLWPDSANDVDGRAVGAWDWSGRFVGHVAQEYRDRAWQMMRASGRSSLRGRVCEVDAEMKRVVFECSLTMLETAENLFVPAEFGGWKYTGPVLKPTPELMRLDYMMDEIDERLRESCKWTAGERADFVELCTRFCRLSKFDISGEMSDFRIRLGLRLQEMNDDAMLPIVDELHAAFGRSGRETQGGEVLDHWTRVLSEPSMVRPLLVRHRDYDLQRIGDELESFPEAMYREWVENREHFVAKLLYMHIPRVVLWQLASGIAFFEAMSARNRERREAVDCDVAAKSSVHLKKFKGSKIDIIRVLNVLYEQGYFQGTDGASLTKKEFFTTMGQAMNMDFSDYNKDLSRALSDSTSIEKQTRVFEDMKQKMIDIWNSK